MTKSAPILAMNGLARAAASFLESGLDTVVVGPPGCGTTMVGSLVENALASDGHLFTKLDCRSQGGATEPAVARLKKLANTERPTDGGVPPLLLIDHVCDLSPEERSEVAAIATGGPASWKAVLWLGPIDCSTFQRANGNSLYAAPRTHLHFPELVQDDLLRVYQYILMEKGCRWGESLLYFALDWCGNDFCLLSGLAEQFYGDWSDRLYDETVAVGLSKWLGSDSRVNDYRNRIKRLPATCSRYKRLLNYGGKLLRHGPELLYETDGALRSMFLEGLLCRNLLPRYYTTRHLVAKSCLNESAGRSPAMDPFRLLRRTANERVSGLLQDVELVLRQVMIALVELHPERDWPAWFGSKKTDEEFLNPELHKLLLSWIADYGGTERGQEMRGALAKLLADERKKFEGSHNLWVGLCTRWRFESNEVGVPTTAEVIDFLTFNELANLVQALQDEIFPKQNWDRLGLQAPKQRWPVYMSRVRKLRNRAAHLRNMGFQDIEDMLSDVKSLRDDLARFAFDP